MSDKTQMKITPTTIPEVLVIEPKVFGDARGFFFESFNQKAFNQVTGLNEAFVQDNLSRSSHNVLRGLHYQVQQPQGKLVQVMAGEIFDVAVDLRQSSPSFGRWIATILSATNCLQHWIPSGFSRGFLVTSASADVLYKTTGYYAPNTSAPFTGTTPPSAFSGHCKVSRSCPPKTSRLGR